MNPILPTLSTISTISTISTTSTTESTKSLEEIKHIRQAQVRRKLESMNMLRKGIMQVYNATTTKVCEQEGHYYDKACRILRKGMEPQLKGNALVLIADFSRSKEQIHGKVINGIRYDPKLINSFKSIENDYATIYRPLTNVESMCNEVETDAADRGSVNLLVILSHGTADTINISKSSVFSSHTELSPKRKCLRALDRDAEIILNSCSTGLNVANHLYNQTHDTVTVYAPLIDVTNFEYDPLQNGTTAIFGNSNRSNYTYTTTKIITAERK